MKIAPPRFDLWFWLLVVWAFVVPFLFDHAHITSCDRDGIVRFNIVVASRAFTCKPLDQP
jgi:hypothetical protein